MKSAQIPAMLAARRYPSFVVEENNFNGETQVMNSPPNNVATAREKMRKIEIICLAKVSLHTQTSAIRLNLP